ncbi:MAG: hypothetical protein MJZ62_03995 [Bacteroidales bacterium]|nr:hypothetical protein [Bacteroidales bacterium]
MENKMDSLKARLAKMSATLQRIEDNGAASLEVDLLLADLRAMYEQVLNLNAEAPAPAVEPQAEAEERPMAEPVAEPEPVVAAVAEPEIAPEPEPEPVPEPEPEPVVEEKPVEEEVKEEPVQIKEEPVQIKEEPVQPKEERVQPQAEPAPQPAPLAAKATIKTVSLADAPQAEPTFAPEPVSFEPQVEAVSQPSLEELEQPGNDLLFEETPAPQPKQNEQTSLFETLQSQPSTIYDALATKAGSTLADSMVRPVSAPKAETYTQPAPIAAPKAEPAAVPPVESASLIDLLKQSNSTSTQEPTVKTLADMYSQNKSDAERNFDKKVDDLRTIININDKFSFMSELFHGNMRVYNDFILQLNSISDRETAMVAVSEMAERQNWDMESLAVKTFFAIFNRKF